MNEVSLGIKITADASQAKVEVKGLDGTVTQLGSTSRKASQDITTLSEAWAKFSKQGSKSLSAVEWANQLSKASTGPRTLPRPITSLSPSCSELPKPIGLVWKIRPLYIPACHPACARWEPVRPIF